MDEEQEDQQKPAWYFKISTYIVGVTILFILWVISLAFFPLYNVWERGLSGKAELSQAEYSRQIKVVEAQAKLESEKLNAQSEVVRAEGVAKANFIIAGSITEQYIRYLWVKTLDGAEKQVIYVPTEANLPITEAQRLKP